MSPSELSAKDLEDARKTKLENDKAQQELDEWRSPSSQALREAKRKKEAAEAQRDSATAKAAEIKTYVPDLSAVERGKLETSGDAALFGSVLSLQALENAARAVVKELTAGSWLPDNYRVMVTTNMDLVSTEATLLEVKQSLDELIEAAESLVNPEVRTVEQRGPVRTIVSLVAPAVPALVKAVPAVAQAVAAALPSVLSLLSAHRSVSAQPIAGDDEAASLAVAAALAEADREATVIHESFSLLKDSALAAKRARLRRLKIELVGLKAELSPTPEGSRNDVTQDVVTPDEDESGVFGRVASAPILEVGSDRELQELIQLLSSGGPWDKETVLSANNRAARLAILNEVLSSIESFETAVDVVPQDAAKSLFAIALLQERLHSEVDKMKHVLLIKSRSGSTQRLLDDRPLMFDDKFSTVASTGISFLLLEIATGRVLAGGSKTASQSLSGNIGGDFIVKSVNAL